MPHEDGERTSKFTGSDFLSELDIVECDRPSLCKITKRGKNESGSLQNNINELTNSRCMYNL